MATRSLDIIVGAKNQTGPGLSSSLASLKSWAGSIGSSMNGIRSNMAGVFAGISASVATTVTNAMVQIAQIPGALLKAGEEQVQASTKLAAVLAATGNAAGFTAQQLEAYSSQLQSMTTFGDEVVTNAQAIIATFSNIKNDTFKATTAAALDLATVMGTDLQGAAKTLGKALNDPTQGLTVLRKLGIQFTDQQKEQIKTMQEAGNVTGAQNVILGELAGKFGGAAAAMANTPFGQMKQLANQVSDVFEDMGIALAGAMAPFVKLTSGIVSSLAGMFGSFTSSVGAWIDSVREPVAAAVAWWGTNVAPTFVGYLLYIKDAFTGFADFVGSAISATVGFIVEGFAAIGVNFGTLSNAFAWVRDAADAFFATMGFAFQNWRQILEIGLLQATLGIVSFGNQVQYVFTEVIPGLLTWFGDNWRELFTDWLAFNKAVWTNLATNAAQFFKALWSWMNGDGFNFEWKGLTEGFKSTLKELPKIAERQKGDLEKALGSQITGLQDQLGVSFDLFIADRVRRTGDAASSIVGSILSAFRKGTASGAGRAFVGHAEDDDDTSASSDSGKSSGGGKDRSSGGSSYSAPERFESRIASGFAQAQLARFSAGYEQTTMQSQQTIATTVQQIRDTVLARLPSAAAAVNAAGAVAKGLPGALGGLLGIGAQAASTVLAGRQMGDRTSNPSQSTLAPNKAEVDAAKSSGESVKVLEEIRDLLSGGRIAVFGLA